MQIIISGRNAEISEPLRNRLEEQFRRLAKYESGVTRVEVTLAGEKKRTIAEGTLSVNRRGRLHAHAEAEDSRTAADRLFDKLSRQLKKQRSRNRERRVEVPITQSAAEEGEV